MTAPRPDPTLLQKIMSNPAEMMEKFKEMLGPGTRENGIYRVPGQQEHDGQVFSGGMIPSELDRIKDSLEFNEKDVISNGYPKTGSTWTNEIIYLVCNNADVEKAARTPPMEKLPFLEMNPFRDPKKLDGITALPSPRTIKTHLPVRYYKRNIDKLDKGPKVVVSMRNPRDNLVSFFHFYRMNPELGCFDGDWNEFFELFKMKKLVYGDVFQYNIEWWALKDHPNVYINKYEDMKKDPFKEVSKIAHFLGCPLSEAQIEAIVEATRFDNMKKSGSHKMFDSKDDPNKTFFRKGKVGGWREYFTQEQSDYIDKLVAEKYAPVGLMFDS